MTTWIARISKALVWSGLGLVLVFYASFAQAEGQQQGAFYYQADAGGRLVSGADADTFFNGIPGAQTPGFGLATSLVADGAVGFQPDGPLGLELGGTYESARTFNKTYFNAGGDPDAQGSASWQVSGVYVMPTANFWSGQGLWGTPAFQSLGLRFGYDFLSGSLSNTQGAAAGTYAQTAAAPAYGLVYRYQGFAGRDFDLGLEFAYDWIIFNKVTNAGGVQATTLDGGGKLQVNDSGLSLKVILRGWFPSPLGSARTEAR